MIEADDDLNLHDKHIYLIKIENHYELLYHKDGIAFQNRDK
jgi:hypothetical protein